MHEKVAQVHALFRPRILKATGALIRKTPIL
ncbi:hypothetical protein N185_17635 [Sinorhizobium sp. GW3]|nr:hypothetical protein N185_17635 [Sinorhizobium sp. GW3]